MRWIIVDDGPVAQDISFERDGWTLEVVRPTPFWSEGQNTQSRNLLAGLAVVGKDDRLVIIEDDDYYAKDWLRVVDLHLEHSELVGESPSRYYNVASRLARPIRNTAHSSLCSTAMRGSAIKSFEQICKSRVKFIDIELWRSVKKRTLFTGERVVGIKGLDGRFGIGMGHRKDFTGLNDRDGSILRQWIGEDAKEYQ